jgi:lysine 2,3-aminomutase
MKEANDESLCPDGSTEVARKYAFRLTPYLRDLLRGRPPEDPLAVQFLPDARELRQLPDEIADPIGDGAFSPVKGIVHRYPDRALLKVLHSCPAYCRFCFRREMVGHRGEALSQAELDAALDYVRAHPEIWEIILTGGEPLGLSNRRLASILGRLSEISHLSVLRIHSRMITMDPERIDAACAQVLRQPLPVYLVAHINHPEEITPSAARAHQLLARALQLLIEHGVTLLSHTVLLKGINDDAKVLERLFRELVRLKVRPYYLHHGDLAPGTSHFRVSIEKGQELMRALRGRVSGLCQPTYVLDIPGGFGKVPIGSTYVGPRDGAGGRDVLDYQGHRHRYPE